MVFMRVLPSAIISAVLIAGCAKKDRNVFHPAQQSDTATVQDSGKAFGKYYSDASENPAAHSQNTFTMKKPGKGPSTASAKSGLTKPAAATADGLQGSPEISSDGKYVLQIACAANSDDADAIALKFKNKGFPVYVLEVTNPVAGMEGTYYRVRIGNFRTRANAIAFGEKYVKPEGYDYWADFKANEMRGSAPSSPSSELFPVSPKTPTPAAQLTPVSSGSNQSLAPAASKTDSRIWDTASDFAFPSKSSGNLNRGVKPSISPKPVQNRGASPLKTDSPGITPPQSKSSIMHSPLDLLLKVYDTDSSSKTTAGRKKDSASIIPSFEAPPATAVSEPVKSTAGSKEGGR